MPESLCMLRIHGIVTRHLIVSHIVLCSDVRGIVFFPIVAQVFVFLCLKLKSEFCCRLSPPPPPLRWWFWLPPSVALILLLCLFFPTFCIEG